MTIAAVAATDLPTPLYAPPIGLPDPAEEAALAADPGPATPPDYRQLLADADASGAAPAAVGGDGAADDPIRALGDELYERLRSRLVTCRRTGCWEYPSTDRDGNIGLMRVGDGQYTASKVAAWVWLGGFDLADRSVRVEHVCGNPYCCHYEHLRVVVAPPESEGGPSLFDLFGDCADAGDAGHAADPS